MISDNSTTTSSDEYSDGSTGMGLRFEPVTCSTPKRKDYKSPEMPEKRRRAPVFNTDVSMMPKVARVVRLRNRDSDKIQADEFQIDNQLLSQPDKINQ